jgi:hypothetical protein
VFPSSKSSSFQLSLREIQSRNFKETEKSESSKALLQEAKQLFNLPARAFGKILLLFNNPLFFCF